MVKNIKETFGIFVQNKAGELYKMTKIEKFVKKIKNYDPFW